MFLTGTDISNQYSGDLRQETTGEKYAYLQCGGFNYEYFDGSLLRVTWLYDGYLFCLDSYQDDVLPITDETAQFIRDLLHTDTAERAMQTFKASMESAEVK